MPSAIYFPQAHLKELVSYFWYCSESNVAQYTISLPIHQMELVLNYSDVYEITDKTGKTLLKNSRFWLSGLQTGHMQTKIEGKNESLGIVFKAQGMNAFSKHPMNAYSGLHIGLEDIWQKDIQFLWEEIHETAVVNEKFILLEQFLLKQLKTLRDIGPDLSIPLKRLDHHAEKFKVQDLYKELKISKKTLNHLFKKYIGLSPGEYKRLLIFNKSLEGFHSLGKEKLSTIGYDFNYFDQAHFIREFSSFSGLTPGQYLAYCMNNKTSAAYPNYIDFEG